MSVSQRTRIVWSCVIVVSIVALFSVLVYANDHKLSKTYKSIFDHGKYSREAGVSSEANPWRGRRGTHWLDGWAEGNPQ